MHLKKKGNNIAKIIFCIFLQGIYPSLFVILQPHRFLVTFNQQEQASTCQKHYNSKFQIAIDMFILVMQIKLYKNDKYEEVIYYEQSASICKISA